MRLSLVVHAHQPPGNFDSVFHEGVDRCYGPFLDLLEEHPHVRMSLHFSGSLLEWLEANAPERVAQVRRLVERGQVEPVAAGLYEPVLALLPPHDRAGQLRAHRALLRRLFGADTHTGWLTERVWEPSMVRALRAGGIDTVTLDERHFLSAGLASSDLTGPFTTEYLGETLTIAPGSETLRMTIPWRPVREVIAEIRRMVDAGVQLAVFGDDMEKFGMWPGTYRSVIQGGWLRRFYRELAKLGDAVELVPLGEAVAATPPVDRVYLPDGSYPEMLAWSLPPGRQRELARVQERLRRARLLEATAPFMRSGVYFQFLAKYPEANHLHKRMLDVSRRVAARLGRSPLSDTARDRDLPPAVRALWRAQANDSYWHGWFGGTYLPLLRRDPWRSLLRAEHQLARLGERPRAVRVFDLDADGHDEAVLANDTLTLVVDPQEGGALVELSDRSREINLGDTLARRPEAYHPSGREAPPYDHGRRAMLIDRFLPAGGPPSRRAEIDDRGDFAGRPYTLTARRAPRAEGAGARAVLERTAAAPGGTARVRKQIDLAPKGGVVDVRYRVTADDGHVAARFGVELNFGVYFQQVTRGRATAGARDIDLRRGGAARNVLSASVALEGPDVAVHIESSAPVDVDMRPVSTVSQSERGLERTPQALACLLTWPLSLGAGESFDVTLRVAVDGGRGGRR